MKPRARADVIARPIGDEVVVYDPQTHAAHCLNRTAALVFGAADGRRSVTALAARLAEATGAELPEDVVWATLDRLGEANLLEAQPPSQATEPSRRQALRTVGLGIAALAPVVASLVVPTPAEAANTCIPATSCTTTNLGQPCWNTSAAAECPTKVCTGVAGQCQ